MFTAGWNMPGYLPEFDPQEFETFREAQQFLVEEVERFWDQDQMGDSDTADAADGRWLPVHTALHVAGGPGATHFAAHTGDDSLAFWITPKEAF